MPYAISVWLDDDTAEMLEKLTVKEDRTRSGMVKVLIRREARSIAHNELCGRDLLQVNKDSDDVYNTPPVSAA